MGPGPTIFGVMMHQIFVFTAIAVASLFTGYILGTILDAIDDLEHVKANCVAQESE